MIPAVVANGWRTKLKSEWLLVLFAALGLVLAAIDPQPLAAYRRWLQWPTLAGLLGLLIAIQGIRDSGLVQHAAVAVVARAHSLRSLGLLLVSATALLSMVLTRICCCGSTRACRSCGLRRRCCQPLRRCSRW